MLLLWLLTCCCRLPVSFIKEISRNWHPDVWDLHAKHGAFIVHAQTFVAVGDCKGAPVLLGSCFGIISWSHQYQANMFYLRPFKRKHLRFRPKTSKVHPPGGIRKKHQLKHQVSRQGRQGIKDEAQILRSSHWEWDLLIQLLRICKFLVACIC